MAIYDTAVITASVNLLNDRLRGQLILRNAPDEAYEDKTRMVKTRQEMDEAIATSRLDIANLQGILDGIAKAETEGSFAAAKEVATADIIAVINDLATVAGLVPPDFEPPEVLSDGGTVIVQ